MTSPLPTDFVNVANPASPGGARAADAAFLNLLTGTVNGLGFPEAFDSFATKPDGALGTSDSGHAWTATGAVPPQVRLGALGYPAGHTPGSGAGYGLLPLSGSVVHTGMLLRWDASDTAGSSVAMGIFDTTAPSTSVGNSPAHLSITPYGLQFSVFTGGTSGFTSLTPEGFTTNFPHFPTGMLCDGSTLYPVRIVLDRLQSRAYVAVGDHAVLVYKDSRIGSITASWPFWEPYSVTNNDNLPRIPLLWASSYLPSQRAPGPGLLDVMQAGSARREGASTSAARATSLWRPGSTWYTVNPGTTLAAATSMMGMTITSPDPIPNGSVVTIDTGANAETRTTSGGSGTAAPYSATVASLAKSHAAGVAITVPGRPVISDGDAWRDLRDPSGFIVGNRVSGDYATAKVDQGGILSGNATRSRVRAPSGIGWATPGAYRLLCTTAGTVFAYLATAVPVEAGAPFLAFTGQAIASAARSTYCALRFLDSSGSAIGSDVVSAVANLPTSGSPATFVTAPAFAPSNAVTAQWLIFVSGCAVNDTVTLTQIGVAFADGPTTGPPKN